MYVFFETCVSLKTRSVCEVNISVRVHVHVTHWKINYELLKFCLPRWGEGGGERGTTENMDILCALRRKTHVLCFQNSYKTYIFGALRQRIHTKHISWKTKYFSSDFYRQ